MPDDSVMRLLYLALLLAALGGWAAVEMRKDWGKTLKMVLAWGMIFLGMMAVFGLWGDIQRGMKPRQQVSAASVTLPRAQDGHYYAELAINGKTLTFMADTGASTVVLSPNDARKIGIDPAKLAFMGEALTANGMVRTARVSLPNVTFGPFHEEALPASVNQAPMDVSLLGMEYLGRFQISITGDQMILMR